MAEIELLSRDSGYRRIVFHFQVVEHWIRLPATELSAANIDEKENKTEEQHKNCHSVAHISKAQSVRKNSSYVGRNDGAECKTKIVNTSGLVIKARVLPEVLSCAYHVHDLGEKRYDYERNRNSLDCKASEHQNLAFREEKQLRRSNQKQGTEPDQEAKENGYSSLNSFCHIPNKS